MNRRLVLICLAILVISLLAACDEPPSQSAAKKTPSTATQSVSAQQAAATAGPPPVPAHLESAPSINSMAPVLPADQYVGEAKESYLAVKEIPQTIAQLPCYCHCDKTLGHKSLHTCFETAHASTCGICIGEALMAYRLQKEKGLTPPQIREAIIAAYGAH